MSVKTDAMNSAAKVKPPGGSDYVRGYMAGHAAHTRSANKRLQPFISKAIEELQTVEREIGVPSQALRLLGIHLTPKRQSESENGNA